MEDEKWRIGDWLIIFSPLIYIPIILLFYGDFIGSLNILGIEIPLAIIVAVIAFLSPIISIVLKHFLYDRKQYKNILKMLGEFKDTSLENKLGINKGDKSISAQLGVNNDKRSISAQLGVNNDNKSITGQLDDLVKLTGIGFNDKTLTGQHKDILNFLTYEKRKADEVFNKFNESEIEIKNEIDKLTLILKDWERKTVEITELKKENIELSSKIVDLKNNLSSQRRGKMR